MIVASIKAPDQLGKLVGSPGETLTATLKRTITEMILFGFFAQDARLYPHELALRFEVSATPVREALMQLTMEGLIEATPRRGFHIRTPTKAQVADLWHVRLGLELTAVEGVIARLGAGEMAASEIRALASVQAQRDEFGVRMTTKEHIETNAAFHHKLVELSGNRLLLNVFGSIHMQLIGAWVQRGVESWRARLTEDAQEHHAIIDALLARDVEQCRRVMRRHVGRSLQGALVDLAAQQDATNRPTTINEQGGST